LRWGFRLIETAAQVPLQMVFVPNDFSNSYVITHWTDPSNYATTSDAPFATSLINTTQILPAPTSKDAQASYAASNTALAQIDSAGNIYYIASVVQSDYDVSTSPTWTKMSYTLAGTGGTVSSSNTTSNSTSAAGAAGATTSGSSASASASQTSVMSGSSSASAAAKTSGSSTSASAAASATSSKAAAGVKAELMRGDLLGLALGFIALGGAMVL